MSFFKAFFASLSAFFVGILILISLSFILIVGLCYVCESALSKKNTLTQGSGEKRVLLLSLEGQITDKEEGDAYGYYFGEDAKQSLKTITTSIKRAKDDSSIEGIYIRPGIMQTGYATLEEIRKSLLDFKESGKFIVSYSGSYTQGSYYVSSVSDKIYLNPQGMLDFRGIASSSIFYKPLLDTLGVDMQVIKVGTYKSFTEKYTSDTMSGANREQVNEMIGTIWASILKDIAQSRGMDTMLLASMADEMIPFQTARQVKKLGLVDSLLYVDEVEREVKKRIGIGESKEYTLLSMDDYIEEEDILSKDKKGEKEGKIAVVYASGEIDNGNTGGISSSKYVKQLLSLRDDDEVKAVVLRVNSPGGSAYGAEQIWHAVERLKEMKPVVVSMGDYAASGGYYMSAGADYIMADEKTITGSIGVFCVIPNVQRLTEKIGVRQEIVRTNRNSDLLSNFLRPLTENERDVLQNHVGEVYNVFLERCSKGRKRTMEEVENIAEGRVWSGTDALKIGLVDKIGTLDDAINHASKLVGLNISGYQVVTYPKEKNWWERMTELPSIGYEKMKTSIDPLSEIRREMQMIERLQEMDKDQAVIPFELEIK